MLSHHVSWFVGTADQPAALSFLELTQDQRLSQAKQQARSSAERTIEDTLVESFEKAQQRRFTGEPLTNFGAMA